MAFVKALGWSQGSAQFYEFGTGGQAVEGSRSRGAIGSDSYTQGYKGQDRIKGRMQVSDDYVC
ncbi:hypothetical protein EZS27_011003 [termite gut metagenome]|uniref:Uncharacterized protein n=1 Tax=termite gut metagenome TaxID=433724 RepID=A0A5J4S4V7_9ZZZZ